MALKRVSQLFVKILLVLIISFASLSCSDLSIFDDIINGRKLLQKLEVKPKSTTFALVENQRLQAFGSYENGDVEDLSGQVTWDSSEPSVGYVTTGGTFQAVSVGGTVITARTGGLEATAEISVQKNAGTIFVSADYSGGFNDGTAAKPFQSVAQGVAYALLKGSARVKVAKGEYSEETILISSDIELTGGYNPGNTASDWQTDVENGSAELVDPADTVIETTGGSAILCLDGLSEVTVISNFTISGNQNSETITSVGITIQNSSPVITNNHIYAGLSEGTAVGILNQNSAPTIQDNPIISAANHDGNSNAATSFAILNQSFSNPNIKGNGDDTSPSQTITGPETGSSSSYRIKNEGSSGGSIENNYIDIKTSQGILVVSSSPGITGNTLASDDTLPVSIRGENTSFVVSGNTIGGHVEITSTSLGAELASNYMAGTLVIRGTSKEIVIRDHAIIDEDHHYGVTDDIQINRMVVQDNAGVTLERSVVNEVLVESGGILIMSDCVVLTNGRKGVEIDGGAAYLYRNYIENLGDNNQTSAIWISDPSSAMYITGNVIYNYSSIANASSGLGAVGITYHSLPDILPVTSNNLVIVRAFDTTNLDLKGVAAIDYGSNSYQKLYNNIFHVVHDGGTQTSTGYYDYMDAKHASAFTANFFMGFDDTINDEGIVQTLSTFDDNYDDNDLNDGDYQGNVDSGITHDWLLPDGMGGNYASAQACIDANGGSAFNCDFSIGASSDFIGVAVAAEDVGDKVHYTGDASPDKAGNCRDTTTGNFSSGPYEHSGSVIACPE